MDNRTNEIVVKYIKQIQEIYNPISIYLYGSHAKGNANKYSDIDIAVIISPINAEEYINIFGELFAIVAKFDADIEPNLLIDDGKNDKYSFLHEVKTTGIKICI